jgi:hypothetical protein
MTTHSIQIYKATARDVDEYPELSFLGVDNLKAIEEWRGARQKWVFLKSKVETQQTQ